jgi:hypothetical protein
MEEKIMFDFNRAIKLWEEYLDRENILFIKKEDIDKEKLTYLLVSKTNIKIRMEIDQREVSTEINIKFKDAQDKSPELLREFADKVNEEMQWNDPRFKYDDDQTFKYNQHNMLVDVDDIINIYESVIEFITDVSDIFVPGIKFITDIKQAIKKTLEFMEQ